ncbi:MAG: DUF2031 domain-containing protein [Proteobacteria bacterium]|nr:DUF2031 domain-containing protein [Pseudomonadota bacterium]MBU1586264.1 DUF2031 domain-containing protein [Pseudomonadota bacterium]MBU2453160.1 DUF2031 domain-containing protein [Pseudomonadota bacterium]MBU2630809.1 DUF2031 domain-containing protein [Pseudomonadota bacterium]
MKNCSNILLIVIIILGFNNTCLASPLSNIISFFQRDLVINVLYKNHKNLIQGSEVYLAEDPKNQKVLIGKVKKVSLVESQMSKVEIIIEKKYKERIYETTPFVLMSNFFSENSNVYILAISSLEEPDKTPLKSGSSVNGVTFLEYNLATAGEELKKILDSIKKQNNELLSQLEQYVNTFNTEDFYKKMDDLINQISEFSTEQKETFKKEVLPSLRKTFDSMMEKLQEQNNMKKSKDLEKRLKKIEDLVDV